jgi:ubiquinone/menaquinone biosynthesis C-methylase UbiE
MTGQRESWQDEARVDRYSWQSRIGSRIMYAPFARQVAQSVTAMKQGAVIVDLGTGPGLLAIELHKLWPRARIIGIDPSEAMLSTATKNAVEAEISQFEARLGTAEEIPCTSDSVDLVVSQSSYHEWADPRKGLGEIFRILRPGGILVLRDYSRTWLSPWKRKLLGLFHHLEMFKFTFAQANELLVQTGFDTVGGEDRGVQWFAQAVKR